MKNKRKTDGDPVPMYAKFYVKEVKISALFYISFIIVNANSKMWVLESH